MSADASREAPKSGAVRRWITECVDRIAWWCEIGSGAWTAVEAPAVATGMRDAVAVAAITEFGSPTG
ncbi:hypothetical protein ACQP0C_35430 [Nocardia sp. CA-129566]|uniref:hypothetical protein n=1 Tax=Nocardia sp. CA-129566 TaxID=3239976 RepID=UPI003D990BFD